MKLLSEIRNIQEDFIQELIFTSRRYVDSIDKNSFDVILLSGSVARGDYMPGKFGGMIDLTVILKSDCKINPVAIFGANQEPDIPYHCITFMGYKFQILILDSINETSFYNLSEGRMYALLESQILWESDSGFSNRFKKIKESLPVYLRNKTENSLNYVNYLLSPYKVDRWDKREAKPQLHWNLNIAIQESLKCLYYINGKFSPPEDRILYYSYELEKLPRGYSNIISELMKQSIDSWTDYKRREALFSQNIIQFIKLKFSYSE